MLLVSSEEEENFAVKSASGNFYRHRLSLCDCYIALKSFFDIEVSLSCDLCKDFEVAMSAVELVNLYKIMDGGKGIPQGMEGDFPHVV